MSAVISDLLSYLGSAKKLLVLVPLRLSRKREIELLLDKLIRMLEEEARRG